MKIDVSPWLLLIATLPTSSTTARMRLWRATKTLGCAPLRDGAYLLPSGHGNDDALTELAAQTNADGGQAWVVNLSARAADDEAAFLALFDRSDGYRELAAECEQARKNLLAQAAAAIEKTVKRLRKELESLQRIDFFPGDASISCEAAWWELNDAANALLSPDEPRQQARPIMTLNRDDYQGKTWATRRRLWVDRVASAWLIQRFIDGEAQFLWLESPAQCPRHALGFDFDNAAFTHVGNKVTFEVLMTSFGLNGDASLVRIAALVHALDVGTASTPEAAGFAAVLSGARERLPDDDALLREIGVVLDSLYVHFKKTGSS